MSRRVRRSVFSTDSLARIGTLRKAGIAIVARMPMIAITMISSSRVKPCWPEWTFGRRRLISFSPLPVGNAVQAHAPRQGVDVVDVLAPPGGRIEGVLVAAQPPFALAGHRIDRNPAQELQLLVHLADHRHPF